MISSEEAARAFVVARCDAAAMARLEQFCTALASENERQNLVAAPTLGIVWQRHIADSAQLLDHVPRETFAAEGLWLDLGSGAGLPGLIIAIMRPEIPVLLVESRRKRIDWLESVSQTLGLTNCRVAGMRLEAVEAVPAAVISARAFAPLPQILRLSARFSTKETLWVLPKGRSAAQELADLPVRMRRLFHVEPSQTDVEAGIVVGRLEKGVNSKA